MKSKDNAEAQSTQRLAEKAREKQEKAGEKQEKARERREKGGGMRLPGRKTAGLADSPCATGTGGGGLELFDQG